MREIVVISGKGGAGKTSISASFAYLSPPETVIADCDVDAADMHLLMKPRIVQQEDFYSSQEAVINPDLCTGCDLCYQVCRFDAISREDGIYSVIPLNCEGCAYCEKVCPVQAITMKARLDGQWFISETRLDKPMVHARLGIGTENSGKLVTLVKNVARKIAEKYNKDFIIVDGAPGVGCPVIASISGASFVVLVSEPTVSGIHDLKRVYDLVRRFGIPAGLIINKYDINPEKTQEIISFAQQNAIFLISQIPYDESFVQAQIRGLTMAEYGSRQIKKLLRQSWETVMELSE